MTRGPRAEERRRSPRVEVAATAAVFEQDRYCGTFTVENLSAGGALLVGDPNIGAEGPLSLSLQIPKWEPLTLGIDLVRRGARGTGEQVFAVAFREVPSEVEEALYRLVVASLEKQQLEASPAVLVIDDSLEVSNALVRELKALGHRALAAPSAREGLAAFIERAGGVEAALVDLKLGKEDGLEVLDFLGERFPKLRRVLMSGEALPFQLELARSSGRAHAVMEKPWTREGLKEALHLR